MIEKNTEDIFHLGIKALIRNTRGDILLLQVNPAMLHGDQSNYWDLPGGRVQKGQTDIDTLAREIEEEIGVSKIQNTQHVGMVLSNIRIPVNGDTVGLILSIYQCELPSDAIITLSEEHTAYDWFPPVVAAQLLKIKYPTDFCEQVASLSSRS